MDADVHRARIHPGSPRPRRRSSEVARAARPCEGRGRPRDPWTGADGPGGMPWQLASRAAIRTQIPSLAATPSGVRVAYGHPFCLAIWTLTDWPLTSTFPIGKVSS